MTRKGGGRESGAKLASREAGSTPEVQGTAAANPAAHHILDCEFCMGWFNAREKRIRELEALMVEENWRYEEQRRRAERAEAAARTEATAAQIHFEARQRLEARVAELVKLLEAPCPFCGSGANETYRVAVARERALQKALHARESRIPLDSKE